MPFVTVHPFRFEEDHSDRGVNPQSAMRVNPAILLR